MEINLHGTVIVHASGKASVLTITLAIVRAEGKCHSACVANDDRFSGVGRADGTRYLVRTGHTLDDYSLARKGCSARESPTDVIIKSGINKDISELVDKDDGGHTA